MSLQASIGSSADMATVCLCVHNDDIVFVFFTGVISYLELCNEDMQEFLQLKQNKPL